MCTIIGQDTILSNGDKISHTQSYLPSEIYTERTGKMVIEDAEAANYFKEEVQLFVGFIKYR